MQLLLTTNAELKKIILIHIINMAFFLNNWFSIFSVIQSSHPVCNTIMLIGIIVCLTSVFLIGLDGRFVHPSVYPAICQTRAWALSMGFTLSFGAMFSKVWRVHRLTTKAKSDPKVRTVSLWFMLRIFGTKKTN